MEIKDFNNILKSRLGFREDTELCNFFGISRQNLKFSTENNTPIKWKTFKTEKEAIIYYENFIQQVKGELYE